MIADQTEAAAGRELTLEALAASAKPFIIDGPNDRKFIAKPSDDGGWSTEEILPRPNEMAPFLPKIIAQVVQLQDCNSLVEYVNRFKNSNSVLFANIATNDILAIVDYHKESGTGEQHESARLTNHRANLHMPFSVEWMTWTGHDGRLMSHVDFATFLEENAIDIMPLGRMVDATGQQIEDAPSTMLELCRELQVKGGYGASSSVRNGDYTNVEMQKGDDVSTKRNVALPASFRLQLPVYFGEPAVPIDAFLRRDTRDGVLKLGFKLNRAENVRQDEFHRIVGVVANNVELTTLYGKPA